MVACKLRAEKQQAREAKQQEKLQRREEIERKKEFPSDSDEDEVKEEECPEEKEDEEDNDVEVEDEGQRCSESENWMDRDGLPARRFSRREREELQLLSKDEVAPGNIFAYQHKNLAPEPHSVRQERYQLWHVKNHYDYDKWTTCRSCKRYYAYAWYCDGGSLRWSFYSEMPNRLCAECIDSSTPTTRHGMIEADEVADQKKWEVISKSQMQQDRCILCGVVTQTRHFRTKAKTVACAACKSAVAKMRS